MFELLRSVSTVGGTSHLLLAPAEVQATELSGNPCARQPATSTVSLGEGMTYPYSVQPAHKHLMHLDHFNLHYSSVFILVVLVLAGMAVLVTRRVSEYKRYEAVVYAIACFLILLGALPPLAAIILGGILGCVGVIWLFIAILNFDWD